MGNILMCCFLLGLIQICGGLHLRAYFDQVDIRGYVQFGQHNITSNLLINFHFKSDLRAFTNIEFMVTNQPSVYDEWCKNVGSVIYNLSKSHGYINYNSNFTDGHVKVSGKDSILGSSLVLYENDTAIACSTILPHGNVDYATANIFSPKVGGSFNFIQYEKGGNTFIYGNMQDSSSSNTTRNYDVYISADTGNHKTCHLLNQIYNPKESYGNCSKSQEDTCKIGALSSKHGELSIGNGATGKLIGVDINLPLIGDYSILSRYVVIKSNDNKIVGCGKINIAGPLEVTATFDAGKDKGISGYLKFSQQSPYHFTKFTTKLYGLKKRVSGYHVHRFPISDHKSPCSPASVGGHVNTWNVDIKSSPSPFNGSLDMYEVGDLSGRYGGLKNLSNYNYETNDANLPLYGLYTILGRSIVIHENSGQRFVCSNIEPEKYKLKMSSTANFTEVKNSPVSGTVKSMQYIQQNGITTRTITIVNIQNKDGKKSGDHKWSIHTKSVSGNKCPNEGDSYNKLYNPVNVHTTGSFCSEMQPFLCAIGDLSDKVGKYDMKNGKRFFSDVNLPMFGEMTSVGHSIVFNKENSSNKALACANVIPDVGRAVSKLSFNVQDKKLKDDVVQLHRMLMNAFEFPTTQDFRINSLNTYLIEGNNDCFRTDFYVIDTNTPANAASYRCVLSQILNSTEKMKPFKKCVEKVSSALIFTPSVIVIALSVLGTLLL